MSAIWVQKINTTVCSWIYGIWDAAKVAVKDLAQMPSANVSAELKEKKDRCFRN